MNHWKHDPLYRLIFREVLSLKRGLDRPGHGCAPDGYRLEEVPSGSAVPTPAGSRPENVWVWDDSGLRLFPGLAKFPHDAGEIREGCWQFGLVQFSISPARTSVTVAASIGPGRLRSSDYAVVGDAASIRLERFEGSLTESV